MDDINFIAVIVATVAAMVIGGVYYMPALFGLRMTEMAKAAYIERDPGRAMLFQVGFTLVTVLVLAFLFARYGVVGAGEGALAGLGVWAIVAMAEAGATNFSGRPWALWLLNQGNRIITFVAAGAILGAL